MFYHNTRYAFKLPDQSPDNISGGILLASAMAWPQLSYRVRRTLRRYPHLQHRLFDPQLYLAGIEAGKARSVVINLGTYPWFRCAHDAYDSNDAEGGLKQWKDEQADRIATGWTRSVPSDSTGIAECAKSAVELQQMLGCEAIILPSPMTILPGNYTTETEWIDAGLDACRSLRVSVPVYATVALADTALRQQVPAQSQFLQTITAQIASRDGLTGAYIVVAQETEDGYVCKSVDTLLSLLLLTDDLVRGAGCDVVVNYMGTFGFVASAVGARIWGSGYYRSQRRLRTSDMDDGIGFMYPRYYSHRFLGDIGVEKDLDLVAKHPVLKRILSDTPAAAHLNDVLRNGGAVGDVLEWEYRQTNIAAAAGHYNTLMNELDLALSALDPSARVDTMHKILTRAERVADQVRDAITVNGRRGTVTDTASQRAWREAFEAWRQITGL